MKLLNHLSLIGVYMTLIGCATTQNLAQKDNSLPEKERAIAQEIARAVPKGCVFIQHAGDYKPLSGQSTTDEDAVIKRFFVSSTDWYKASFVVKGIWGDGYFNSKTKRFICGDRAWGTYQDASQIQFREYGTPVKTLN
jgi:hypothetical protein